MRMKKIVLSCAAAWCLATVAAARDIYVNNVSGDDRMEGGAARGVSGIRGPVRTIAKALRLAQAGDHIILANTSEPYREAIGLMGSKNSGLPGFPFVIEGNGATLDGSKGVPADAWKYHGGDVFCFRPEKLGFQQLFTRGRPAVRHPTTPADVTLPSLEPLEWCLSEGRVFFRVEEGRLPDDYELSCCHERVGITLYHVEGVVIENLIVQGFQLDGVNASDVVRDVSLSGLTCCGNGRSGIRAGGASRVDIDNCVLADNGQAQLLCEDYSRTHVNDCQLIANTAAALVLRGGSVSIDGQEAAVIDR